MVAAPRRSASLAAPILGISAIAGSMVLTLSFAADAATATIRDTLQASIVVTAPENRPDSAPENGRDPGERILSVPGVSAVDTAIPLGIIRTDRDDAEVDDAEGIDPAVAARTRDLAAITVTVGLLIRRAMTEGMVEVPTTVPWVTLVSIAAVCLVLAVGSALTPTTLILRRSHPSGAVE